MKNRLRDNIALGIIDEDQGKGSVANYFLEFKLVKSENNLLLKKHTKRNQYLILICPEIEVWLLNDAKSISINPSEYNLPENLNGLKKLSKTQNIDNNADFHRFVKALIRNNAPSITTLKGWLELFNRKELHKL